MVLGIILIIGGIISFAGAFFGWDWYIGSSKAQNLVKILGTEDRVQIFYEILSVLIIIFGILGVLGIVNLRLF